MQENSVCSRHWKITIVESVALCSLVDLDCTKKIFSVFCSFCARRIGPISFHIRSSI